MTLSYAFGGNSGQSYDELQRRRAFAEGLLQRGMSGQPKTAIEGINSAASSIIGALLARKFGAQDAAAKQDYSNSIAGLFGGQSQPTYQPPPQGGPQTPDLFATPNPGNLPQSTISAVDRVSPNIPQDFSKIEQAYGLPQGYLGQVAQIESGGNPNAQNPNSSAGGMFQFLDSTAKQYGLTDKTDPYASADAAARLAADNQAYLRKVLGRDPTAGELYLAHQQGAAGAAQLLSNPNAPASSVVGNSAVNLNGGSPGMTAGQFADQWTGKVMQAMADPRATDAQRNLLGMLLEQRMKQSDPAYQVGLAKDRAELAALNNPQAKVPELVTTRLMLANQAGLQPGTPEWQNFMVTGNTIGRGANEYGLTPQIGRDKDGNPVLLQVGKDGTAVTTKLPDGVTVALDEKAFQSAKGQAAGKAAGGAAVNMQPAEITAKQLNDQIDSVLNDPNLNAMVGPLQGRLPNMSGASQAFQGRLDQIKGSLFLQAYTILKGGGQITEIEGQKATDAMARLSTAQNETDFRQALNDIRGVIQAGLDRIKSQADYSTSPGQPAPADQSGGATYTYDPVTGELK